VSTPQAFRDFLRSRSRTIRSRAEEAGFFEHNPTRGVARENVLIEPMREILPARYGLATGEIRAHDGAVSGQWDVIIYDAPNTPRLYDSGTSVVLPIETVYVVVSVKSRVDGNAISDTAVAAARLRQMPRREMPVSGMQLTTNEPQPAAFLFGFRGVSLETARTAAGHVASAHTPLNGICILDSGLVMPVDAQGPTPNIAAIQTYKHVETAVDGSFGVFVANLWAMLHTAPLHAPDLIAYIDLGRMAGHLPE
jgi:uncharacterized protein DUF6602